MPEGAAIEITEAVFLNDPDECETYCVSEADILENSGEAKKQQGIFGPEKVAREPVYWAGR